MKSKSIRIPLESRLYLADQQTLQRGGHHISKSTIERITNESKRTYNKNGFVVMNGDFGGAVGKPENSYEEGRWTSWTIETMKEMLDKVKLPWYDNEDIECMDVHF